MLITSPRIHRRARAGSLDRHCDANRLVLRHVALDPDKCPVVVEDQRVAGEPQGVEVLPAVRVDEEEVVWLAGDPVTDVPADVDLLDRPAGPERLLEEDLVELAARLHDEDGHPGET